MDLKIKELRKNANLSQQTLAKKIGVSQKAVDFWERGVNEPKASYIVRLAEVFGVTTDCILGRKAAEPDCSDSLSHMKND